MFGRFNRDHRMLLAFATQEAADLGQPQIGNDHLILGMLCNARSPLFTLLGEQGLNLAGAREAARAYHEAHDTDDEAVAEQGAADRYDEDKEALRSIGIDLDKVREAVRDRFGDDLSEGWAERSGRGRGRGGRGRGECGPHGRGRGRGHGHGRGRGRGRGEFSAENDPRAGFGPGTEGGPFPGGFGPGGFGPDGFGPDGPFADGPWEPGRGRRGPRGRGGRPRFAADTRDALQAAVGYARERGDHQLRVEYLLLGIIDTADDASRAVIDSATTAEDLKAAVFASLPEVEAGV